LERDHASVPRCYCRSSRRRDHPGSWRKRSSGVLRHQGGRRMLRELLIALGKLASKLNGVHLNRHSVSCARRVGYFPRAQLLRESGPACERCVRPRISDDNRAAVSRSCASNPKQRFLVLMAAGLRWGGPRRRRPALPGRRSDGCRRGVRTRDLAADEGAATGNDRADQFFSLATARGRH
jgi:hypothetical protein